MPKQITEMWAWVCTEPDGDEGVPACELDGAVMPLLGADKERVMSLRPFALRIARELGLPLKLVRFTSMEVIEHLMAEPQGSA